MARVRVRVSIFCLMLVFVPSFVFLASSSHEIGRHTLSSFSRSRNGQSPNCREIASRSECLRSAKCRWCRSNAIDDMCFSTTEAWRLPQQGRGSSVSNLCAWTGPRPPGLTISPNRPA